MKIEPRTAISGLRVAGVMALLASLLLPAASALSYAMTIYSEPDPTTASLGDTVDFYYTLENTGDLKLYNIAVEGLGTNPDVVPILEVGEVIDVYGSYTIVEEDVINGGSYSYILNEATATAYNSKGRKVVISLAGCPVMVV